MYIPRAWHALCSESLSCISILSTGVFDQGGRIKRQTSAFEGTGCLGSDSYWLNCVARWYIYTKYIYSYILYTWKKYKVTGRLGDSTHHRLFDPERNNLPMFCVTLMVSLAVFVSKVGDHTSVLAAEGAAAGGGFKDSQGGAVVAVDHVSAEVTGEVGLARRGYVNS